MAYQNKIVYILLGLICIFSFVLTFSVHINYSLPYHADEWTHAAYVVELDKTGHIPDYWPFDGEHRKTGFDLESGFHLFYYSLFKLTGINLIALATFLPAMTSVITMLMTFVFMRFIFDEKVALISAFLVATLKTNITLLGPMFFVPVTFVFPIMLLTTFFFLEAVEQDNKKYFILSIISFFAIALYHPTSAMALMIPFVAYVILRHEFILKNWKLLLLGALAVFLVFLFYTPSFFQNPYALADFFNRRAVYSGFSDESGIEIFFFLPNFVGPLITVLSAIGTYVCLVARDKKGWVIPIIFIANLVWVLMYYYMNFSYFVPYRRALLYVAEMMYLLAAVGAAGVCYYLHTLLKQKMNSKLMITIFVIFISALFIYQTATAPKFTNFFYMDLSEKDYSNLMFFKSITEDVTIMCKPEICQAIFPVTGHHVVSTMSVIDKRNTDSRLFFDSNCTIKESLIQEYNVSYVYSEQNIDCQSLSQVSMNIYHVI